MKRPLRRSFFISVNSGILIYHVFFEMIILKFFVIVIRDPLT